MPKESNALPFVAIKNKRISFPLELNQTHNYINKRITVIGDQAQSFHPLAGLGMNLGVAQSTILANIILCNHKAGCDIG